MSDPLALFQPVIADWFHATFPGPTEAQTLAWPAIAAGEHVLVTAPTGSGKTFTAFLWALNQLIAGPEHGGWDAGRTRVLYISPLKALNQDIRRNLLDPLDALNQRSGTAIRAEVRSGDSTQAERRRMLRFPPEILITTPESLNILLTSKGGRDLLTGIQTVLLDEIHAVYGTKRGVYLMSAIDRLTRLNGEFQRVALSATVRPLDAVAAFVAGFTHPGRPRPIRTIQAPGDKTYNLQVNWLDRPEFEPEKDAMFKPLVEEIRATALRNRSTLIFVNSRRMAEKITWLVNKEQDDGPIAYAHHGALSREIRMDVEARLKAGKLKAIISTSTLELGIDIGALDEVLMFQPPQSIAATIQRLGRAGHQVGAVSYGRLIPMYPRELIESQVLATLVPAGDLEPVSPVDLPLDVLAQVIVSCVCSETRYAAELYEAIRCSHPFRDLTREQFDRVLHMLNGRYEDARIRELKPRVSWDPDDDSIIARKGARLALYTSGGVIADRGYYQLRHANSNARIGELDEEFVWEARIGQTFTFGTQTWKIQRVTPNDVLVLPGATNASAPPFWRAESGMRDAFFANHIADFLERAGQHLKNKPFWDDMPALNPSARNALHEYLAKQVEHTRGELPHRHHLLIEHINSGPGGNPGSQIVLHTLWGGRVNQPLALALEETWATTFGEELRTYVGDYNIAMIMTQRVTTEELMDLLLTLDLETALRRRLESSGFFGARFREAAGVAMMLPSRGFDKRTPLWVSRLKAQQMMSALKDRPDFPMLLEAWRHCLRDEFDLGSLRTKLDELAAGSIRWTAVNSQTPSPLAQSDAWRQINEFMYMDDAPAGGKLRSNLSDELIREIAAEPALRPRIPQELIDDFEQRRQRLAPGYSPEDERELLDWVRERVLLPSDEFDALLAAMRRDERPVDEILKACGKRILTDQHGCRSIADALARLEGETQATALAEWLSFYGPLGLSEIARKIGTALANECDALELVRGQLSEDATTEELCDPSNYEALLRMRRARAGLSITPRPVTDLPGVLASWQELGRDREGSEGLRHALESLLLLPGPAALWEREWLPARIQRYDPAQLDGLLQEAALRWQGCGTTELCFHLDGDRPLLPSSGHELHHLFPDALARYDFSGLQTRIGGGAGKLAETLWTGVWAGQIGNDGFTALRRGIDNKFAIPKVSEAASGRGRRGAFKNWQAAIPYGGNWYALAPLDAPEDHLEEQEHARERARVVLDRYGIVFRELLARELHGFRWRDIFRALRLMELSGEILTGWFYEGVPGPQFALPSAIATHRRPEPHIWWINATDPISPCGIGLEATKGIYPRRVAGNHLTFRGTELIAVSERNGKSLTVHIEPDDPDASEALRILHHIFDRDQAPLRRITIEEINGEDPTSSPWRPLLEANFSVAPDYKKLQLSRAY